ncbi:hypothetical protein D3C87_2023680 [compost metagenome]|jgi:hypothetical protein
MTKVVEGPVEFRQKACRMQVCRGLAVEVQVVQMRSGDQSPLVLHSARWPVRYITRDFLKYPECPLASVLGDGVGRCCAGGEYAAQT